MGHFFYFNSILIEFGQAPYTCFFLNIEEKFFLAYWVEN